jgi:DNA repair protein RadC
MKHLAPYDRPREKLERLGPAALGDNELLAVILGSGSRDAGALALANQLLAHVDGLYGLTRADAGELRQIPGIGAARAAQVLAAVELGRRTLVRGPIARPQLTSPRELALHLVPQFGASPVEQFGLVMLDSKLHILRIKIIAIGSIDSTVAHPREVFREAAVASAAAIVLFHNHPSGDPTPSSEDLELTERMLEAGDVMGIHVVDNIILTAHRYFSLQEGGLLATIR